MRHSFWRRSRLALLGLLCLNAGAVISRGAETEFQYLSGKGKDDPVQWDFLCNNGQNANKPSKINVPSNWELQGFGVYTYGRDGGGRGGGGWPKVRGVYSRSFAAPATWSDKKVYLVFEGAMTDTQATINGQSAGPIHQGGFYRFQYDVTKLIHPGQDNALQVTVDDESANLSVNNAERRADYWNYGGIYRPVYLEILPKESIDRVAIDAKADGSLTADAAVDGLSADASAARGGAWTVEGQVLDLAGKPVGAAFSQPAGAAAHLAAAIASPHLWNAETPNLYQLELRLKQGDQVVHSVRQKFGFRTIEVRLPAADGTGDKGIYVNGQRILFKGICRHSFWPDSGRCLSEAINRADVQLMKDMNMNAVRMTHYPPDASFLAACDELGIYVLDELAGWHARYDTNVGHTLVEEMVTHDVNHPAVVMWDNGNEGGSNTMLDDDFTKWDPQKRPVLHPWAAFRGIDTKHYPNWADLHEHLASNNIYFPTEMLHGNYDGGGGAGLADYWNVMLKDKSSAGGFIWGFADEDIVRTDQGGKLDSRGNSAPDGVLGPYREKEGSFYAIREIWSPLVVTRDGKSADAGGDTFTVENRYNFTDARDCSFTWEYRRFKRPDEQGTGYTVIESGKATVEGSVLPGKTGKLMLAFHDEDRATPHDALAITAKDPAGHELWTWVWSTGSSWMSLLDFPATGKATATENADTLTLTGGNIVLKISKETGELLSLSNAGGLYNGPRLVTGSGTLASLTHKADGNDIVATATYTGDLKSFTYRMRPNGWMTLAYDYTMTGPQQFHGVGFDYMETTVRSIRFLGSGPYRVWKNRTQGGTLNVWEKPYNNTITGDISNLAPGEKLIYPEFKGYHADVRWFQMQVGNTPVTVLLHQDNTYVQFFTPQFSSTREQGKSQVNFPGADISFLNAIPAIGYKFVPPSITGPQGQEAVAHGEYKGAFSIYAGQL